MAEHLTRASVPLGATVAEPTATALSPPGYELQDEIGRGGMGVVYRARDTGLDRDVAVKLLSERYAPDSVAAQRFLSEARITGQLQHPGIPAVHQFGTLADGRPFLAMKLIKGNTLETILKYGPDPSADRGPAAGGLAIFEAVCQAVGYAHAHRVIHRDLKPANVMVGAFGEVQVMDWGLSKVLGQGSPGAADALSADETQAWTQVSPAPASGSHTQAGSLVGTPAFIPPEQALGEIEKVDERSDVFGLGAILAVILTGKPPYVGESFESVRVQAVRGKLEDCFARLDACGAEPELVALCKKCLAFEPADRPADAGAVAQAVAGLRAAADERARQAELERVQAEADARAAEADARAAEADARAADARAAEQRRRRRMLLAASGLIALVLLAGLSVSLWQMRRAMQAETEANTNEEKANQNAQQADKSRKDTEEALKTVESEKTRALAAEGLARAEEEAGRKLLYTTDMRLAPFLWRDDRTTAEQLRVLLTRHIPSGRMKDEGGRTKGENAVAEGFGSSFILHPSSLDLRGFEWYYYQYLLKHSAAVFSGHDVAVVGGAFTSDGQLVTLDQNCQVRRWDLGSQDEDQASRRALRGGPSAQVPVLSPNGRLAALAEGNKVHVFDTSTGTETFQIDSANVSTRGLIFSQDEGRFVIVDDKIRWCDAVSGEVIASVDRKFDRVASLALSADGLTLAVAGSGVLGNQFSIFRLDARKKKVTPLAKDVDSLSLGASALSPDGQRIAVGATLDGPVRVYDTTTGGEIATHRSAHASPISALAFSGDGAKLATADTEGTIKIWADAQKLNAKSTALVTLKGHHGAINTLGFSSDGKRLASTCMDKTARVWDLENAGAAIRPLERTSRYAAFVGRFSSDGQWIAADNATSVRLWDAATGRPVLELPAGGKAYVGGVAFSPTDHRLLALGCGGPADVSYVALWDIDAGTELARLPAASDLPDFRVDDNSGRVGELAFSPDGKYLVAGFGPKWRVKSESSPNPLKVWDVATRRLIRRLNGHTGYCVSLDFTRDGKLLASGSGDGTAIIWSTKTWNKAHTLENPDPPGQVSQGRSQVAGVAFSPDGKTLAVAGFAGTVQLWDVATGELRGSLKGHSSAVLAVAFSPDGRTLASGSVDETVRLWNVATRRQLMQLDSGSVEMGQVYTLAFSAGGERLLAAGNRTAMWSAAPIVWNDPNRAAEKLRLLLQSNASFQTRIRMLSENLRLHEALAKLDAKDVRVQAALAATQANWHASRQAWPEAALAFDRLLAADPTELQAWLRTPGLLRVATALLHQDRPDDAAMLLQGGTKWRAQDPVMFRQTGLGFLWAPEGGLRLRDVFPGSPAARGNLLPGDVVVKVNGTATANSTMLEVQRMIAGGVGTKVRLTVRHPGRTETQDVELVKANNLQDEATAKLFAQLLAALEKRLANDPKDAGLLELRAEVAGEESDFARQAADCTAAIKILAEQPAKAVSAPLRRLYRRRGDAYASLEKWPEAVADYARVVTAETTDDALLSNQALAQANLILEREAPATWTVLQPTEMKSKGGATLSKLPDDSILASGQNSNGDAYTIVAQTKVTQVSVIRLEALTHESLPDHQGPGRHPSGNFAMDKFTITAHVPGRQPHLIDVSRVAADHFIFGLSTGNWNIGGGESRPHTAVYLAKQPVDCQEGARLQFQMQFSESSEWPRHNLGRFRLSVSSDPASFDREQKLFPVMNLGDPWQRLAGAYRILGSEAAIDQLVQRRPKLAGPIGDLFTQGKDEGKDWRRAISLYSKAITAVNTDVELLSKRARASEALKNWDAAAADWSRAAIGNPDAAKLLAEFARRLAAGGQVPLATAHFEKSRALYERALEAEPENDLVAPELAQLLWDKHANENPAPWTVLTPVEAHSQLGATLSILPDNSILASGANPPRDRYRVVLNVGAKINLAAVRLEALMHPSLPGNGPGRYPGRDGRLRGTFAQESWNVTATPPKRKNPITLVFDNGWADHQFEDQPLKSNGQWNITLGGEGRNCTAVWSLSKPVSLATGSMLAFEMQGHSSQGSGENLGHFRLSVSNVPAALDWEQKRFAAMQLTDPWARLAAAYYLLGDRHALDKLLKHHPEAAAGVGDVYAAAGDWERAIAEYRKAITDQPADSLLTKLATAYQSAGRTREGVAYLAKASAANPKDRLLSLKVAALQAWFGREKELADTLQRIRAFAKDTSDAGTAERAARTCSIVPSANKAELDAALALARKGVELGTGEEGAEWRLLALGMAEYRNGNAAAAEEALLAAEKAGPNNRTANGIAAFYRAMSLFRQGKPDEARKVAIAATAKMKPLPKDEQNPLANGADHDDLILWLAYKEAKAMIQFDAAPPAKAENDKK